MSLRTDTNFLEKCVFAGNVKYFRHNLRANFISADHSRFDNSYNIVF